MADPYVALVRLGLVGCENDVLMKNSRVAVATVLILIAVVLLARLVWWTPEKTAGRRALHTRSIATSVLAAYISQAAAGESVVVMSNPFAGRPGQPAHVRDFEEAGLEGLRHAWAGGKQAFDIELPALNPAAETNPAALMLDPNTTTPISYLQAERAWDTVLKKHQGVGVVVSLIGFPADTLESEFWKGPKPRLAMLLPDIRFIGGPEGMLAAFGSGKLVAIVLRRPGSPSENTPPAGDAKAEFEKRYLLVTRDNVATMVQDFPTAFRQ